jgi:MoxR-like ATPase
MVDAPANEVLAYKKPVGEFVDDAGLWAKGQTAGQLGDRRDGAVYRMHPRLRLAVDLALTTGRPLLLRGEPGSGKSSLAPYLARNLKSRFYDEVVTATTRVEDFLWRFDTVARLSDAQARRAKDPPLDNTKYVVPGVLWKAFDPDRTFSVRGKRNAVVLIDEIDKADPDVPNGLLVPIGSGRFPVPPLDRDVTVRSDVRVVVVITTNEERQLPPAFLRRCVVAAIPPPDPETLVAIARLHLAGPDGGALTPADEALIGVLATKLVELRGRATRRERPPGIAEFLDAVRACKDLGVDPAEDSPTWRAVEEYTLRKPTDTE